MEKNICAHCGGKIEEKKVTVDRRVNGSLFVFENVPAEVCTVCGSKWFSLNTLKEMDRDISEHLKPARIAKIPVFSFGPGAKQLARKGR